MSNLRILLVEENGERADELMKSLAGADHSAVPVGNLEEAGEALFLEKFEAILLGSAQTSESLASFSLALRTIEARQRIRIPVISCLALNGEANYVDGHLQCGFVFSKLAEMVSELQKTRADAGVAQLNRDWPVFEPHQFEEQCAGESELMIEILDLFSAECRQELPEMAEALLTENFDRIARIAHTLKGSLGSLHAPQARMLAQALEGAAKEENRELCAGTLASLEAGLEVLKDRLTGFRRTLLER